MTILFIKTRVEEIEDVMTDQTDSGNFRSIKSVTCIN